MALTRIQIVNQALDQAQLDSSFQAKGRNWLNIIIQKLSLRQNYLFYRVTQDTLFVPLQTQYNLPSDFQRADTIYFIDSNGNQGNGIYLADSYQFDRWITNADGFPQFAYVKDEDGKLIFNSAPSTVQGQGFRFNYFKKPDALSLDATDDNVVPDFKDQFTLIEELIAMAYEFLDDERYKDKKMDAMKSNVDYQRLLNQTDGNSKMDLNAWVFRPTRRGYNRNSW